MNVIFGRSSFWARRSSFSSPTPKDSSPPCSRAAKKPPPSASPSSPPTACGWAFFQVLEKCGLSRRLARALYPRRPSALPLRGQTGPSPSPARNIAANLLGLPGAPTPARRRRNAEIPRRAKTATPPKCSSSSTPPACRSCPRPSSPCAPPQAPLPLPTSSCPPSSRPSSPPSSVPLSSASPLSPCAGKRGAPHEIPLPSSPPSLHRPLRLCPRAARPPLRLLHRGRQRRHPPPRLPSSPTSCPCSSCPNSLNKAASPPPSRGRSPPSSPPSASRPKSGKLVLVKPFSGSGSTALLTDLLGPLRPRQLHRPLRLRRLRLQRDRLLHLCRLLRRKQKESRTPRPHRPLFQLHQPPLRLPPLQTPSNFLIFFMRDLTIFL